MRGRFFQKTKGQANIVLDNIRIIMVNTSHPGNIGAAARGMKTMGLKQLYLVTPRTSFPHAEITARAAGADDILANTRIVDSLEDALLDCRLSLGCSARGRAISLPLLTPRAAAKQALTVATAAPVGIVFGNEQHGLSNIELEHCLFQVCIPTNPDFSSLNVAASIQIIAYEIYTLFHEHINTNTKNNNAHPQATPPATAQEMQLFYEHLESTLIHIGFLNPNNPRKLMQRLHRFFNRAQPETTEISLLRGILTATLQKNNH